MVKVPEMGPRDVGSVLEQGVLSTPEVAAWEEGSDQQQQGESRNWAAFSIFAAGVRLGNKQLLMGWRRWDYLGKKKERN